MAYKQILDPSTGINTQHMFNHAYVVIYYIGHSSSSTLEWNIAGGNSPFSEEYVDSLIPELSVNTVRMHEERGGEGGEGGVVVVL